RSQQDRQEAKLRFRNPTRGLSVADACLAPWSLLSCVSTASRNSTNILLQASSDIIAEMPPRVTQFE
ncbi:hypothetical protein BN1708_006842, partial [Verticillium longisporum]